MKKYIDKTALVAEIDEKLQDLIVCKKDAVYAEERVILRAKIDMCKEILSLLDTLEVKEVDDEKCKEYDKALSIAKAWYKSSDSSAQERHVALMIMGDKVREEL